MSSFAANRRGHAEGLATPIRGPSFDVLDQLQAGTLASLLLINDKGGQLGAWHVGFEPHSNVRRNKTHYLSACQANPHRIDHRVEPPETIRDLRSRFWIAKLRQERFDGMSVFNQHWTNVHRSTVNLPADRHGPRGAAQFVGVRTSSRRACLPALVEPSHVQHDLIGWDRRSHVAGCLARAVRRPWRCPYLQSTVCEPFSLERLNRADPGAAVSRRVTLGVSRAHSWRPRGVAPPDR